MLYDYHGIVYSFYVFTLSGGLYFIYKNRELLQLSNLKYTFYVRDFLNYFMKIGLTDMSRKLLLFVSLLVFRIIIVQFLGVDQNGLFQAIWSISLYPDILIAAFVTFYFPTISGVKKKEDLRAKINSNFEYAYYLVLPVLAIIMIIPDIFLRLLFDSSFLVVEYDLKLLIFFKIFQVIYTFFTVTFFGQTYLRRFLICEIIRTFSLIISGYLLIPVMNLQGAVLSMILMQCMSMIPVGYYIVKDSHIRIEKNNYKELLKGSLILAILLVPYQEIIGRLITIAIFLVLSFIMLDMSKYREMIKTILPVSK